jgi:hypothetical protein
VVFKIKRLEWVLVFLSVLVNLVYLSQELQCSAIQKRLHATGEMWTGWAYSYYNHGISNKIERLDPLKNGYILYSGKEKKIIDFVNPPVGETLGYPILASTVWRLTGVPSLLYMKIINIIIFSLISILLFRINIFFVKEPWMAFICSLGVVAFPPLLYVNIIWFRDIFQYFGIIFFLYFFIYFVSSKKGNKFLYLGIFTCILCQWIRASLFSSFFILSCLAFIFGLYRYFDNKKTLYFLKFFWISNILLFWVPFMTFNKVTYNTYFVAPTEEALFCSLCSPYPLPNGDMLKAEDYPDYTNEQVRIGKLDPKISFYERYDILYKDICKKYPYRKIECLIYRIKEIAFGNIQWRPLDLSTSFSLYRYIENFNFGRVSIKDLPELFLHSYIPFMRLFGWIGIMIAIYRKKYFMVSMLLIGVVYSSGYMLLSHIEDRIIAVHAWPFGLFAFYSFGIIYKKIKLKIKNVVF